MMNVFQSLTFSKREKLGLGSVKFDFRMECAPAGGQNQAGVLTLWRAC